MPRVAKQKMDMSQLYLYVKERRTRDYYNIDCTVVAYDHKQNALLHRYDYPIPQALAVFDGFLITAQGNNNDERTTEGLYGFRYVYKEIYEVGLDKAQQMADILARVNKGLEAYDREYGYTRSFGQYVGIIARALGFEYFLFEREPTEYNDSRYSVYDRRYSITKLDNMVAEWQDGTKKEAPVAQDA